MLSSEVVVWVSLAWRLFLHGFSLDVETSEESNHVSGKVVVVGIWEYKVTGLDLFWDGEHVGVSWSIEANSSDEQERSEESCREDHDGILELEWQESQNKSRAYNNEPEFPFFFELESASDEKTQRYAGESTQEGNTNLEEFDHQGTENEAEGQANSKDGPVNPLFSFLFEEDRIDDEHDEKGRENGGDDENCWLDSLSSEEAE